MLRDALGFHIPFVPWSAAERNGHNYEFFKKICNSSNFFNTYYNFKFVYTEILLDRKWYY